MSEVLITKEGKTTVFTINRPEKLNAINKQVALDLQAGFEEFDASDQRVAILTGAGSKAFTSGADVLDLPELWRCVPTIGITTKKPLICALDGWCVGGGMVMVALADLCVATPETKFSYPEGKVGLTGGMIAALAARMPHKLAMEIMLLGRTVSGQRAHEMGLVNEVAPSGGHLDAALKMAEEMAVQAPLVLETLKVLVNDYTLTRSPAEEMAITARDLGRVKNSSDLQEGLAAFREKRTPQFTGQ